MSVSVVKSLYDTAVRAHVQTCIYSSFRVLAVPSDDGQYRPKHVEAKHLLTPIKRRAIVQAVSHCPPTAAARVRAWVRSCGICGGQSGTGAGFLRVLWFPLPIFIPSIAHQSPSSIIWGSYNRPLMAAVTKWTQARPTKNKENK
jgi:hypothetical protein